MLNTGDPRVQEAWWTAVGARQEWVKARMRRLDEEMPWKWARSQLSRITVASHHIQEQTGSLWHGNKLTTGLAVQGS